MVSKEKQALRKYHLLLSKYGVSEVSTEKLPKSETPVSIKDSKITLAIIEKELALIPDTIRTDRVHFLKGDSLQLISQKIDSIYTNINKIKYIRKNHLQTSNMHFLPKSHI